MKTRYIALMGILSAIAIALSSVEFLFTPVLPLGIHIGLANIVIMFALIVFDTKSAFTLVIIKSLFVFLIRGVTAFGMSLSGGILSLLIIVLIYKKCRPSLLLLSVCGAVFHNIGQLCLAAVLTKNASTFLYGGVLLPAGFLAGICTGIVLKIIFPYVKNVNGNYYNGGIK